MLGQSSDLTTNYTLLSMMRKAFKEVDAQNDTLCLNRMLKNAKNAGFSADDFYACVRMLERTKEIKVEKINLFKTKLAWRTNTHESPYY